MQMPTTTTTMTNDDHIGSFLAKPNEPKRIRGLICIVEIHHWCYTCWPLWQPAGPQFRSSHTIASRGEAIRSQNYDLIFKSRLWENCPQMQTPTTTTTTTTTPTTNDDHIGSCWHSQMSQKGFRLLIANSTSIILLQACLQCWILLWNFSTRNHVFCIPIWQVILSRMD